MGIVMVWVGLGLKKLLLKGYLWSGTELTVKKRGLVFSQSKTKFSR